MKPAKKYLTAIVCVPILAILLPLLYCGLGSKEDGIDGIQFGETWLLYNDSCRNKALQQAVRQSLALNPKGLKALSAIDCDSAGCYDLGAVYTQVIYRAGDKHIAAMIPALDEREKKRFASLLPAGLEYGGLVNPKGNGTKQIETEFPAVYRQLSPYLKGQP